MRGGQQMLCVILSWTHPHALIHLSVLIYMPWLCQTIIIEYQLSMSSSSQLLKLLKTRIVLDTPELSVGIWSRMVMEIPELEIVVRSLGNLLYGLSLLTTHLAKLSQINRYIHRSHKNPYKFSFIAWILPGQGNPNILVRKNYIKMKNKYNLNKKREQTQIKMFIKIFTLRLIEKRLHTFCYFTVYIENLF